jgi:hypothetical protein
MVWFTPDCQLEKIFTTNNYKQLIPKLYSLINPNGYVLFTESLYLIRKHKAGSSNKDFLAAVADMDKKGTTGTIEQIDMLKTHLKEKGQKEENIYPFPEYINLNGNRESFLIPFMKEWNQYFLLMKRNDFNVYQKRPQRILSSNAVPSRNILKTTQPNPLSTPVVGPTISNPLKQGVPTISNPLVPDDGKPLIETLTKGSIYAPKNPTQRIRRGQFKKGGSRKHKHKHQHRTQRKKRLDA